MWFAGLLYLLGTTIQKYLTKFLSKENILSLRLSMFPCWVIQDRNSIVLQSENRGYGLLDGLMVYYTAAAQLSLMLLYIDNNFWR